MPDHDHEQWLGMAALAAADMLPDDEVALFEAHHASCRRCQEELSELGAVAGALNAVPIGADMPDPPATLKEGVVWAVRGARRADRRRSRFIPAIAAAAAAIALFGAGLALPEASGPPQERLTVATTQTAVDAQASLVAHTWGTEVKLVLTGLDAGEEYRVTLIDREGERVDAGTFIGVDDRPVVCDMNAAVLRPDATRMEVASADGVVVAADLPAP